MQAAKAAGLLVNQVAAASDQETKLEVDLGAGLDRPQVVAGAHLVGDDAGVARVALGLAADRALAGPVYGQARHVDQAEAGRRQHRFGKAGDAADHVEADGDLALERAQLGDQRLDRVGLVRHRSIDEHRARVVDRRHPMRRLGDVDPDRDSHVRLPEHRLRRRSPPSPASPYTAINRRA